MLSVSYDQNNNYILRDELYSLLQGMNDRAIYKPKSRKGLFCLQRIDNNGKTWTKYNHDLSALIQMYVDTEPFHNWYITPNTFRTYNRSRERTARAGYIYNNIHTINAFYLDFDVINSGLDMVKFRAKLPTILSRSHIDPTAIINSGHGYHVIILLNQGIIVNASVIRRLWHDIQEAILKKVAQVCTNIYGKKVIDDHVSDINRILRVVGSYNVKSSPKPVFIDYLNLNNRPSLWDLKAQWLPKISKHNHGNHYNNVAKSINRYRKYKHHTRRHNYTGNNSFELHWNRCIDIMHLPKLRKYEINKLHNPDPRLIKSWREYALFYYAVNAVWIMSNSHVINNLKKLSKLFNNPIHDYELSHVISELPIIRKKIKNNRYIYTNKKIINDLNIDDNRFEQKRLRTLIEHPEAKERYRQRLLKRKHDRKHARAVRNKRMYLMHRKGFTYKQISKRFGKCTKTVQRAVKAIKSVSCRGGHNPYVDSSCNNLSEVSEALDNLALTRFKRNGAKRSCKFNGNKRVAVVINHHRYYIDLDSN